MLGSLSCIGKPATRREFQFGDRKTPCRIHALSFSPAHFHRQQLRFKRRGVSFLHPCLRQTPGFAQAFQPFIEHHDPLPFVHHRDIRRFDLVRDLSPARIQFRFRDRNRELCDVHPVCAFAERFDRLNDGCGEFLFPGAAERPSTPAFGLDLQRRADAR